MQKQTRAHQLRTISIVAVAALAVAGAMKNIAIGSLSGFGVKGISAICPLGYLETLLASRLMMPRLLLAFAAIVISVVILGRIFCAWMCPIPLIKRFLPKPAANKPAASAPDVAENSGQDFSLPSGVRLPILQSEIRTTSPEPTNRSERDTPGRTSSTGLLVLGGTLLSSAIFGFPVFCLVCPIGLTFATLFAIIRLFHFNEPTMDLILFPAIIAAELLLLRKWCSRICPVGALLSLAGKLNRSLVPTVDAKRCLALSSGTKCDLCRTSCDYEIDLKASQADSRVNQCTKCRECAERCPVHAIHFPLWKRT
ncbi:MAG: 4Fe-4S binding protein [Acidobacteriota bacterium]|nr:4Fe-4S binding protein [Acidobacteriota bacterium]